MLRWIVLALLLVSALSACGDAGQATSPRSASPVSGVAGRVLMAGGPIALGPGGTPIPNSPRPWPGAAVVAHEGLLSGPVVAETKAAQDGAFRMDLPPGDYTLVARSVGATPERVTVASEGGVTVKLYIHVP